MNSLYKSERCHQSNTIWTDHNELIGTHASLACSSIAHDLAERISANLSIVVTCGSRWTASPKRAAHSIFVGTARRHGSPVTGAICWCGVWVNLFGKRTYSTVSSKQHVSCLKQQPPSPGQVCSSSQHSSTSHSASGECDWNINEVIQVGSVAQSKCGHNSPSPSRA